MRSVILSQAGCHDVAVLQEACLQELRRKFTCNQYGSDRYAIKDLEPNYTDEFTLERSAKPNLTCVYFFLICRCCPLLCGVLFVLFL